MADTAQRIDRLEKLFEAAGCDCQSPKGEGCCVVIEPDWSSEQIRIADDAVQFDSQAPALQRPRIVHISPVDARL